MSAASSISQGGVLHEAEEHTPLVDASIQELLGFHTCFFDVDSCTFGPLGVHEGTHQVLQIAGEIVSNLFIQTLPVD